MRSLPNAPWLLIPLSLLVAFAAIAQPKRRPKDPPAKEEAAPPPPEPAAAVDAGAAAAPTTAIDDIGAPPPPRTENGGPTPSPLTPRANEFPDGAVTTPPPDYDKLLGDIAALRGRVAALTTTLFASKLRIIIETEDSDDARIQDFVVTLDDGVVFRAPARFAAEDEKAIYEHAVAPGHHVIGIEIERSDARNKQFQTWQTSRLSVVIPESKLVEAHVAVEEDSDMAEDFPDDEDGEYDLRVRMRARVVEE